ncbi:MAG: hypothetical protein ABXS93_01035 [Sulfurimonas sp.]
MKIKSLLVILLLSLFAVASEAQLFADSSVETVLVEKQASEASDTVEEVDDDDRLFLDLTSGMKDTRKLVKKIDFHKNLLKEEYSLKINKPPIVL